MFCFIYKITNSVNSKVYIGQTWQTLKQRFAVHLSSSGCIKLANAINKYGKDKFTIQTILIVNTQVIADYWEDVFIQKFDSIKSGYNIRTGGSHGKMSEESKMKISLARLGKKSSEETRKKLSVAKIGNTNALGTKHSILTRKKMSDSGKIAQLGENNNAAKLTRAAVSDIRSSAYGSKVLADKYGVSRKTISDIRLFKSWKR